MNFFSLWFGKIEIFFLRKIYFEKLSSFPANWTQRKLSQNETKLKPSAVFELHNLAKKVSKKLNWTLFTGSG